MLASRLEISGSCGVPKAAVTKEKRKTEIPA
jgi:hypothetical protein